MDSHEITVSQIIQQADKCTSDYTADRKYEVTSSKKGVSTNTYRLSFEWYTYTEQIWSGLCRFKTPILVLQENQESGKEQKGHVERR